MNVFTAINATISATGISTLWCPSDSGMSDPQTVPDGSFYDPGPFTMNYTSYAGNFGTWHMGWIPQYNDRLNGLFNCDGAVPIASVTDGLSNTIAFGEHAQDDPRPRRSALLSLVAIGLFERHALHHALPDESAEVDSRTSIDFEHAYCHAASSQHPAAAISRSWMARSGSSRRRSTAGKSTRPPVCPPGSPSIRPVSSMLPLGRSSRSTRPFPPAMAVK